MFRNRLMRPSACLDRKRIEELNIMLAGNQVQTMCSNEYERRSVAIPLQREKKCFTRSKSGRFRIWIERRWRIGWEY